MKIIFTNIVIQHKIFGQIQSAQKLFYSKIFAQKFTRRERRIAVNVQLLCWN